MAALTSAEAAGRGNGQEGLKAAARYLDRAFAGIGLTPATPGAGFLQSFEWLRARSLAESTGRLSVRWHDGRTAVYTDTGLAWTEPVDASLLAPSGTAEGEVVFAGYGISTPEYDDYLGIDVSSKIVLVMRGGPRHLTADAPEMGLTAGRRISAKILNAQRHGAAAVMVFDDPRYAAMAHEVKEPWRPQPFAQPGFQDPGTEPIRIPGLYLRGAVARALLENTDVGAVQERIEGTQRPASFVLPGVKATLESAVLRDAERLDNLVGLVPGTDPAKAGEVIVVGAHYDHDGIRDGKVYPGADDNASGTAALLEIARVCASGQRRHRRTLVFVAFAAEEPKGGVDSLVGSSAFAQAAEANPWRVTAMVNLDMVGRSRDSRSWLKDLLSLERPNDLYVAGPGYAPQLRPLVESANEGVGFDLRFSGWSSTYLLEVMLLGDHRTFFQAGVPVVSLFDDMESDRHTAADTFNRIDVEKVRRAAELAHGIVRRLADADQLPSVDRTAWRRLYMADLYADWRY